MGKTISLVQRVYIASPCPVSWDSMVGDERTRFCDHCNLNVYNLSAMTEEEGERLILEKEGSLCGAFYRRTDGTILTQDCPVGLRTLRRKALNAVARIAAVFVVLVGAAASTLASGIGREEPARSTSYLQTVRSLQRWLRTDAPPPQPLPAGGLALRPIAPQPPTAQTVTNAN